MRPFERWNLHPNQSQGPPSPFPEEAATEVQRRAAEWERQIEHLDAKEIHVGVNPESSHLKRVWGLHPTRDGLQPTSDGLQPTSDGLQAESDGDFSAF